MNIEVWLVFIAHKKCSERAQLGLLLKAQKTLKGDEKSPKVLGLSTLEVYSTILFCR